MKTDHIHGPVRQRVLLDNPDEPLEMIAFTIARYKFACKWMRETDRVLEIGSGPGFGCHFFSRHVAQADGMDRDPAIVAESLRRYPRANLRYFVDDIVKPLRRPEPVYDVAVSFEMIEHVDREGGRAMVANAAAHLKDRGLLVLSTPRAREDRSVSRREMHVFEYDYETLLETLAPHFSRVTVFCQNDELIYAGHPSTAWNYVALCFR